MKPEVFDAELHAIHEGLCAIQSSGLNGPRRPSQILVCVDNQSALTTLSTGNPTNTEFARQALLTIKQLSDDSWSISGLWTLAHCGIPGYEKADALAKLGAAQPGNLECCNARVTKSWLQAKAHSQQVEDWTARHPPDSLFPTKPSTSFPTNLHSYSCEPCFGSRQIRRHWTLTQTTRQNSAPVERSAWRRTFSWTAPASK